MRILVAVDVACANADVNIWILCVEPRVGDRRVTRKLVHFEY